MRLEGWIGTKSCIALQAKIGRFVFIRPIGKFGYVSSKELR